MKLYRMAGPDSLRFYYPEGPSLLQPRAISTPIGRIAPRWATCEPPMLTISARTSCQAVLFSGRNSVGLSHLVRDLRKQYLETQGTLLEFGPHLSIFSREFLDDTLAVKHRAFPSIVEPSLAPAMYTRTLMEAIQRKADLHWGLPEKSPPRGKNTVLESLIEALYHILATQPSQYGRLLIILNEVFAEPVETVSTLLHLAKLAGASVWVTTGTLRAENEKLLKHSGIFDSLVMFGQASAEGGVLSKKLCDAVLGTSGDDANQVSAETFQNLNSGRFIFIKPSNLEFGLMKK